MVNQLQKMPTEKISEEHISLIKNLAHQLKARLPCNIEEDDLMQAGMLGLLDSMQRHKNPSSHEFDTYALQRIRNAMLNELKIIDESPSSVKQNKRKLEAATSLVQQQAGRDPHEQELADKLAIPLPELQKILLDNARHQTVYFEDLNDEDQDESFIDRFYANEADSPLLEVLNQDIQNNVHHLIDTLPEQERLFMWLYCDQELSFREISAIMSLDEAAVTDLFDQIILKIRDQLRSQEWTGGV